MSSACLWTHSGDSHLSEPDHLWMHVLTVADAARMPWSKWGDGDEQIINVDGEIFRRHVPQADRAATAARSRGITDVDARLDDMTSECVWAEVLYCATAMWLHRIRDTALLGRACRALNRWLAEDVPARAPERLVPAALLPPHDPETATSEFEHVAELGLHLVELPCEQRGEADWNHPAWERLWERAARHHVVVGFHATTDHPAVSAAGRGGTLANYAMTGHVGQRTVAKLVAAGVLDRHPDLRVLVAESGVDGSRTSPSAWRRATGRSVRSSTPRWSVARRNASIRRCMRRSSTNRRPEPCTQHSGIRTPCSPTRLSASRRDVGPHATHHSCAARGDRHCRQRATPARNVPGAVSARLKSRADVNCALVLDESFWRMFARCYWEQRPAVFRDVAGAPLLDADELFGAIQAASMHGGPEPNRCSGCGGRADSTSPA